MELFRWVWVLGLLIIIYSGLSYWRQAQKLAGDDPVRRTAFQRLIAWYILIFSLPWLIMGWGFVSANVENLLVYGDFFSPRVPVRLFWATWATIWLGIVLWIFAGRGTQTLNQYLLPLQPKGSAIRRLGVRGTVLAYTVGLLVLYLVLARQMRAPAEMFERIYEATQGQP